jgi:hypothetical protein
MACCRRDEVAVVEVLEQSDRAGPSGRETANRHDAGLQGLRDRGDYDPRYRIDASHPQGTIRTGTSGCPRSTCARSVECRAPSLKSRQYNAGRFPAPAICTRALPICRHLDGVPAGPALNPSGRRPRRRRRIGHRRDRHHRLDTVLPGGARRDHGAGRSAWPIRVSWWRSRFLTSSASVSSRQPRV